MFFLGAWLTTTYLSELSLSNRSRELFDVAPGDELNRLSLAPFADSDSELCESILKDVKNYFIFQTPHQRKTSNTFETLAHLENESDGMLLFYFQLLRTKKCVLSHRKSQRFVALEQYGFRTRVSLQLIWLRECVSAHLEQKYFVKSKKLISWKTVNIDTNKLTVNARVMR